MKHIALVIIVTLIAGCSSGAKKAEVKKNTSGVKFYNVTEETPREEYGLVTASSGMLIYKINDKRFVSGFSGFVKSVFRSKDSDATAVALLPGKYSIGAYYNSNNAPSFTLSFDVKPGGHYGVECIRENNILRVFVVDFKTGEVVAGKR